MNLRERIEQEISQQGPIPFSRYLELCLYEPDMGYYARHAGQFGKSGDFYTSSDVHAVFGRLLARQFEEMWRVLGSPPRIEILELGPGRGLFARDVLDWSEKKFPEFFGAVHYRLYEGSSALRKRLKQTLAHHLESGKCTVVETGLAPSPAAAKTQVVRGHRCSNTTSPTEFAAPSIAGAWGTVQTETGQAPSLPQIPLIVLGNEFFDALPVEVLSSKGKLHVGLHDGSFVETWAQPSAVELEYLDRYSVHPESGERVEVSLAAQNYMQEIAARMHRGFVLVIDYGYTRDELLAGGHRGTIMTYRQHSASPNPYEAPGEQDITAHVNFTALAGAAEKNTMQTQKLVTQSQFLMGIGEANQFADAFEDCRLPQERAKVALQLKHLVTPAGMGESFQVLVASKGVEPERVSHLAGFRFGRGRL